MTAIFISHSANDGEAAETLRQTLAADGHRVFLDADPAEGIAAGAKWEQTLYAKLRECRAVVFLCTPRSLDSMWCFAELTNARSLGRPIFPVLGEPCDPSGTPFAMLADTQFVDLATEAGESRLREALRALDGLFAWDGRRPPYPGLQAFQEEDAALFFGRGDDVRRALDELSALRRTGSARLALFLGASGSGKSSLVRAGLVPRLRSDPDNWVVVPPFRPSEGLGDPHGNLAAVLADAWARYGHPRPAGELRAALDAPGPPHPLLVAARDLAVAAGRRGATVLVVIDQLEELLGHPPASAESAFLGWVCDAGRASQALVSCPLVVLATLRSDFLASLQLSPHTAELESANHLVKAIPRGRFGELIEGPAELVGLRLEPGLVAEVVDDAATENALPLLAFTMAELWKRYGEDGALTLEEYAALGGLASSVQRVVERELTDAGLDAEQEAALHRAFVPHLVQINEEGQHQRRVARRSELPSLALPLLDRLVEARLLVRGEDDTYEVVHESLFRVWARLAAWLGEDRDFLAWQRRVADATTWWLESGREEGALLRGAPLDEARRWAEVRGADLSSAIREFVDAGAALRDREERDRAEHAENLRRRVLASEARELTLAGEANIARDPQLSLLLAIEAAERSLAGEGKPIPAIESLLRRAVLATPRRIALGGGGIEAVAWHSEGRLLAAGSSDGRVLVIDTRPDGPATELAEQDWIESVAWTPDGRWLAAGARDGTVSIWNPSDGGRQKSLRYEDQVQSVDWHPGGAMIAVGLARGDESVVAVHDTAAGRDAYAVPGIRGAWSPDGSALATGGGDGTVRFFTATGEPVCELPGHARYVHAVRWTRDGARVATASVDNSVLVWDAVAHERVAALEAPFALGAAWAPDGSLLAVSSGDRLVTVWDGGSYEGRFSVSASETITGDVISGTGPGGYVVSIDWSPDGDWLAASDRGSFATGEGEVHLIPTVLFKAQTPREWLEVARLQTQRTLTGEELRTYLPAPAAAAPGSPG